MEQDRAFLRELLTGGTKRESIAMVRMHCWKLTQQFLVPLEQYIVRIMPLKAAVSPFRAIPTLPRFVPSAFIASIAAGNGLLQKRQRGNWKALYERFIISPNFKHWWAKKERQANRQLLRLYLDVTREANLSEWTQGKPELAVLDLGLRIKEAIGRATAAGVVSPAEIAGSERALADVLAMLPPDTQACVNGEPAGPR